MSSTNTGSSNSLRLADIPNSRSPLDRVPTELKLLLLESIFSLAVSSPSIHSQNTVTLTGTDFLNFTLISSEFQTLATKLGLIRRFLWIYLREDEDTTVMDESEKEDLKMIEGHNSLGALKMASKMGYLCAVYTKLRLEGGQGGKSGNVDKLRGWRVLDRNFESLLALDSTPDRFLWEMIRTHSLIRNLVYLDRVRISGCNNHQMNVLEKENWYAYRERIRLVQIFFRLILYHPLLFGAPARIYAKTYDSPNYSDVEPLAKMVNRVRRFHLELGVWPYQAVLFAHCGWSQIQTTFQNFIRPNDWIAAARFVLGASSATVDIAHLLETQPCYYHYNEDDAREKVGQEEAGENTESPERQTHQYSHREPPPIRDAIISNFSTLIGLEGLLAYYHAPSRKEIKRIIAQIWRRFPAKIWMQCEWEQCPLPTVLYDRVDWVFECCLNCYFRRLNGGVELPCKVYLTYYNNRFKFDVRDTYAIRAPSEKDISHSLQFCSANDENEFLKDCLPICNMEDEERFHGELDVDHFLRPLTSDASSWELVVNIATQSEVHKDFGWIGEKVVIEKEFVKQNGCWDEMVRSHEEWQRTSRELAESWNQW